jgi:hypothetical protein
VKLKTIGGLLLALICAIGMTVSQSRADNRTAYLSDHPLCEPGTQWDGAACTAVPNCPVGQRWSGTGCVAVECGSGYRLEGSFCVQMRRDPVQHGLSTGRLDLYAAQLPRRAAAERQYL